MLEPREQHIVLEVDILHDVVDQFVGPGIERLPRSTCAFGQDEAVRNGLQMAQKLAMPIMVVTHLRDRELTWGTVLLPHQREELCLFVAHMLLKFGLQRIEGIEAHQSVLGFKSVQSRIVDLPFDEGEWVKAGTPISRVDDSDYRQQVTISNATLDVQKRQLAMAEQNCAAAKKTLESDAADLDLAKLQFTRADDLVKKGAGTIEVRDQTGAALKKANAAIERDQALEQAAERQIDLAEANIHNAEEVLKLAKIVLNYTTLVAPFDGVITVRQAELGEIMVPGTPVVTLADLDHVWLRAYINETDIGKIRLDQAAVVKTDTYTGKSYKGRVSFISSSAEFTPKSVETHAERVTLVYRIKIDIDNPAHELVPGMPADAALEALPAGKS
jgi:HlyD family secretion protein